SVMLLDNDYHISHINPAAKATLKNAEQAIKASYADFDINTIIGCKIDSFCDFPPSVTSRITSRIEISDRSFEIDAAPIINTFGDQLGIVVEWKDITDELAEKAVIEAFEEEINAVVTATTKGDFTKRITTDERDGFLLNLSEGINQIADVSQKGLSEVKETLFALSNGDLSRVITGEYEGTFNDIKETVNETIGQLRNVLGEIQGTVNSIKAGNFTDTIDVSDKTGFLKDLSSSLNEISHVCDKGLSEVGNVLHALSDGDLSKEITGDYEGTFDQLKTTVNKTISQLRSVVSEIQSSANSVKVGDFGNHVDTSNKKGFLLDLSESINDIGEVCSKGLTEVGNVLYALSKGDLSCTVDGDYKGTFEELQNTVNSTISSLQSVMGEIQESVDIVRRGDFTKRINLNGKEGFLLELSKSINQISEISNQGLNEIGDVLKALSNGQIDQKIIGDYEGTFLELKNLVNGTISNLHTVVDEIQDAATSVQDGDFTKRIDVEGKAGFLLDLSLSLNQIGITSARGLNEVERVLKSLSEGSLIDHMEGEYKGTFDEIKNTLNTTLDGLRDMVLKIKQAANSVNTASAEISEGSTDLSKRTEVQASTLEETTAATEQLALTVKKNTMSAQDADIKASEARNIATAGEETVNNAINAMVRIQESSGKVTDIISVI
ncbi:MAG: hypothetical protein MK137_09795, partial [Rickettsiales bacterium]|nr:hypothetical protein [Rickettsiales bacterium]